MHIELNDSMNSKWAKFRNNSVYSNRFWIYFNLSFTVINILIKLYEEYIPDDIKAGDDDNDNDLPEVQPTTVFFLTD